MTEKKKLESDVLDGALIYILRKKWLPNIIDIEKKFNHPYKNGIDTRFSIFRRYNFSINSAGERLRRRERVAADEARKNKLSELRDLIHLEGDLTEDSVVRALQTRFFNQKYFVSSFHCIRNCL